MDYESKYPYEYHLTYWGQVTNENWIEKDLGIKERDFWFSNKLDREIFKLNLEACANRHDVIIVFDENEGSHVRFRTVANMTLCLPNGDKHPYSHDFGYAYPIDSASFMFHDGNYACDCNLSLFLIRNGVNIEEFDCGYEIKIENFNITLEK
jgi:hypothetical protein